MSTEKPPKRLVFHWKTLKGLAAILLFLVVVTLVEYLVVLYAMNLGVKDETLIQRSFQFPSTDWTITMAISPLFHLVPAAVVIALVSSWTHLTRHAAVRPPEKWKGKTKTVAKSGKERKFKGSRKLALKVREFFSRAKSGLLRIRGIAYLWQKIHFARATIKSALMVILVFATLTLFVSLLTYPQLVYWTVSNTYQNNPSLLSFAESVNNFGHGIADALAPIGWICSTLNDALLYIAPGFRNFILSLRGLTKPLVELDDVGKYLVFQNVAAWVSALTALFYGGYRQKTYRHKKRRS